MMNKKILIIVGVILVCFVAGSFLLLEQLPAQLQAQSTKELKLSDFPEAFMESTLIVVGDNASEIELQAANEIADYLENKSGNKPLIKKYSEITEEDRRNYNLIVVGTPETNSLLEEVYVVADAMRVTEEFPGEGRGVLEILPNPWNEERVMLLVEGWDEQSINFTSKRLTKGEINIDLLHPSIRKNGRIFFVTPILPEMAIKSAENAIKHILQNYPRYKVEWIYLVDEPRMPKVYPKLETTRLCWEINFFLAKFEPEAVPSEAHYYAYVDATTGEFIGGWLPE